MTVRMARGHLWVHHSHPEQEWLPGNCPLHTCRSEVVSGKLRVLGVKERQGLGAAGGSSVEGSSRPAGSYKNKTKHLVEFNYPQNTHDTINKETFLSILKSKCWPTVCVGPGGRSVRLCQPRASASGQAVGPGGRSVRLCQLCTSASGQAVGPGGRSVHLCQPCASASGQAMGPGGRSVRLVPPF